MHFENLQSDAFHLVTYLHDQEILLNDSDLDCETEQVNSFLVFGCDGSENDFPKNGFLTFSLAHHSICLHCGSYHVLDFYCGSYHVLDFYCDSFQVWDWGFG